MKEAKPTHAQTYLDRCHGVGKCDVDEKVKYKNTPIA